MSKLAAIINQPVEDRTVVVKHKKQEFVVVGRPSAALIGRILEPTAKNMGARKRHWEKFTGEDLPDGTLNQILLVQGTLVKEDSDLSSRYDETEIAKLAVVDGKLFLKLAKAASDVLGLSEEDDDEETLIKTVMGESEDETSQGSD